MNPRSCHTDVLLECIDVEIQMGGNSVVTGCSFEIGQGEFVILAGPNGAGKTSLLRAIAGVTKYSGTIRFASNEDGNHAHRRTGLPVAYLPQNGEVRWPVSVASLVGLGRLAYGHSLRTMTVGDVAAVRRAMALCAIGDLGDRNAMRLSGGERARALLARALATEAKVLLADEPLASLDPRYQIHTMQLLREYTRGGRSVIAVVHDLAMAVRYSDRIMLMSGGRIVANDSPSALLHNGALEKVFETPLDHLKVLMASWPE